MRFFPSSLPGHECGLHLSLRPLDLLLHIDAAAGRCSAIIQALEVLLQGCRARTISIICYVDKALFRDHLLCFRKFRLINFFSYGGVEETLVAAAILVRPPRALIQTLAAKFREETQIKVFMGEHHHLPSFLPQLCRPPISTEAEDALVVPLLLCCGADAVVPTPRPWEAPFARVVMPMLPCVEASVVL